MKPAKVFMPSGVEISTATVVEDEVAPLRAFILDFRRSDTRRKVVFGLTRAGALTVIEALAVALRQLDAGSKP